MFSAWWKLLDVGVGWEDEEYWWIMCEGDVEEEDLVGDVAVKGGVVNGERGMVNGWAVISPPAGNVGDMLIAWPR